ncbi:terpene synthase family protein [Streptomyces nanshensis]|uniref:Terpene synthase n=1 Tax=Streptomyces nanshensis TaxID=518642 RepID=A0A1E7L4D8_9ACTN|nr:hypothetical protein [Streptomyces nanshensis]OEV11050.1 hypothetical protein AN218_14765 [Streptomyces nanshensis]
MPSAPRARQQLSRPTFYCPIPSRTHPQCAAFDASAMEWLQQQQLADPELLRWLTQADLGELTGRTMPYGDTEALHVVARLHAVLFALDDGLCDEDEEAADPARLTRETGRILAALDAPHAAWREDASAYARALREIREQLATRMTGSQMRRWIEGMRTYLTSLPWEAECRRGATLPCLADYLAMWMRAIGMAPSTALLPAVGGYVVPDDDLDRSGVQALTEMTHVLVALDNDLYSRHKEVSRVGDTLNIVDVLAREYGLGLAEAQHEAVRQRDAVMVQFLRLQETVEPQAGPELRCYVRDLGAFVSGHLEWARNSPRYDRDGHHRGDWWRPHPAVGSRAAPEVSIAGWWQGLAAA